MAHRLRVTEVRQEEPDIGLYVLALIELVRQLQAAEEEQQKSQAPEPAPDDGEEAADV
jgi:hypothetical protein